MDGGRGQNSIYPAWTQTYHVVQVGLKLEVPHASAAGRYSLACTRRANMAVSLNLEENPRCLWRVLLTEDECSEKAVTHESILLCFYRFRMAAGTRHNSFFTPRILISFLWLKCKTLLIWEPSESSTLKAALCAFSKASGLVLKPRCGSGDWCRGEMQTEPCVY